MKLRHAALLLASAILTACGGSGSKDATTPPAPGYYPVQPSTHGHRPPNTLVPAPGNQLSADEQKAYDSSLFSRKRLPKSDTKNGYGIREIYLEGEKIDVTGHDGNGVIAFWDYRNLPRGYASYDHALAHYLDENNAPRHTRMRSYKGYYGGIVQFNDGHTRDNRQYGIETTAEQIPATGHATYKGVAFDEISRGTLEYHVNFADKTGNGTILGLGRHGVITLHPATYKVKNDYLNGTKDFINEGRASTSNGQEMHYSSRFYGHHAEEIGGTVNGWTDTVGFYGAREAVTD